MPTDRQQTCPYWGIRHVWTCIWGSWRFRVYGCACGAQKTEQGFEQITPAEVGGAD